MKALSLLAPLLLLAASAHAEVTPRLNQGDWIVGGSTSLQFVSNGPSYFSLVPEAEYFVANKLALGATGSYSVSGSQHSFIFSPEATIHTKASESVVPYLTIKPFEVHSYTGVSAYYSSAGRIGVKFFLTDSIAFGPAFEGRHYWPKNGGSASNTGTLYGVFSLHL